MNPSKIVARVEPCVFPNGDQYFVVLLGHETIGAFRSVTGGYQVFNTRLIMSSFQEATHNVIDRRIVVLRKMAARYVAALAYPVSLDAIDPSVTDPGTQATRVSSSPSSTCESPLPPTEEPTP